jgi:adenylate kinase
MNIVFLGAPGTGKGTIATKLSQEFGFTHIAPGNLFREEVKNNSHLGKKIKSIIDSGKLVPDEVTNEVVKMHFVDETIFDGYPRTLGQAKALDAFANVELVVFFEMSEEDIILRLSGRRVCPVDGEIYHEKNMPPKKKGVCDRHKVELVQREDDRPEVIKKRFNVYKEQTALLIKYYRDKGILKTVDACTLPDDVYAAVKELVGLE